MAIPKENNVNEFLERIIGYAPVLLGLLGDAKRLLDFEPIESTAKNFPKISELGAKFTNVSEFRGGIEIDGKHLPGHGYYIYGLNGVALVIAVNADKHTIFAIDRVPNKFNLEGKYWGKSITTPNYLRSLRDALDRTLKGENVRFPEVPLRFELSEFKLRHPEAGRIDWHRLPHRVVERARMAIVR